VSKTEAAFLSFFCLGGPHCKTELMAMNTHGEERSVSQGLLEQIGRSTGAEQQDAINKLIEQAEASNDPEDWNNAALGLYQGKRFDEGIDMLTQLVAKFPSQDAYRQNLATAYSQIESIDLSRFHLNYLVEHGSTEEIRRMAENQLSAYEAFLGMGEKDSKLRDFQTGFLKESISLDSTVPKNYIELARLFIWMVKLQPGQEWFKAASEVLEEGLRACSDRREMLELLAYVYVRADPERRLNGVVKELEQIAPESTILETLAEVFRQGGGSASQEMTFRVRMLMDQLSRRDDRMSEAALQDLARIVDQYAQNSSYRVNYALALGMTGHFEEALREATRLDQVADQQYMFHFNLGYIFWRLGDDARGRRHLQLADQYASNEEEKKSVRDRVTELEQLGAAE
jgi:tetratricopeptide (TPR) repeat protein